MIKQLENMERQNIEWKKEEERAKVTLEIETFKKTQVIIQFLPLYMARFSKLCSKKFDYILLLF